MAHYNFRKDIIDGEEGEKFVTECLCKTFNGTLLTNNKTNTHDVLLEFPPQENSMWSGKLSLEIKTDVYIRPDRDTGNMFIEYECRGKPSGIQVTQSDIFIMYFKNLGEIWTIPTNNLKELITTYNFKTVSNAGDRGSKTGGYLIPRMKYKKHFTLYKV